MFQYGTSFLFYIGSFERKNKSINQKRPYQTHININE